MIVKAKLLGLRLGGLDGFANDCVGGLGLVIVSIIEKAGNEVVDAARPLPRAPVVLTARFFRFLGFLPGVVGLCRSKKAVDVGRTCPSCKMWALIWPIAKAEGFPIGDSGDVPGDISVVLESPVIESVPVGDESVESEADVSGLS